jgi:hypothetical protein
VDRQIAQGENLLARSSSFARQDLIAVWRFCSLPAPPRGAAIALSIGGANETSRGSPDAVT